MGIDWDTEVDTPATIAVIGGGPVGVEAALYARFLGYTVVLFDRKKVGDSLLGWGDYALATAQGAPAVWRDVTTSLGLAALEAQGSVALPPLDQPVTARQYVENYLLPVARTDLLHDSIHIHSHVRSVSRVGCSHGETCSRSRRSEQEFRLLVDARNRGEYSLLANVLLDCTGRGIQRVGLASGGGLAIGESAAREHMHFGKCDVRQKRRSVFSGKHCLLFGSDLDACANALDLLQLSKEVAGTKVTWIIQKRIGTKGFQLATNIESEAGVAGELVADARRALESELDHLVPLAAWGIEALAFEQEQWKIVLQTTAEETLDLTADVMINCAELMDVDGFRSTLNVDNAHSDCNPLTGEPHYYRIGQKTSPQRAARSLPAAYPDIREAFGLIGGRSELDLYATVKLASDKESQ